MHVCMHEWFHVEMCIFMFSFIYVCISGYRFLFSMVCMCKNACIHICIFCIVHSVHTSNIYDIDTCIHIYTHVCNRYMYVLNICMHVYVCIYIFLFYMLLLVFWYVSLAYNLFSNYISKCLFLGSFQ